MKTEIRCIFYSYFIVLLIEKNWVYIMVKLLVNLVSLGKEVCFVR